MQQGRLLAGGRACHAQGTQAQKGLLSSCSGPHAPSGAGKPVSAQSGLLLLPAALRKLPPSQLSVLVCTAPAVCVANYEKPSTPLLCSTRWIGTQKQSLLRLRLAANSQEHRSHSQYLPIAWLSLGRLVEPILALQNGLQLPEPDLSPHFWPDFTREVNWWWEPCQTCTAQEHLKR